MTGVFDTDGNFRELYFYKMQGLFEIMTKVAIEVSPELKEKYEKEYKSKITRFSSELEFCLHELGWMIFDPFCQGRDEVLFSNGYRSYVASTDYVKAPNFDRKSIDSDETGFPILTDEYVSYDPELKDYDKMDGGIIDEQGYVSSFFMPSMEDLATLELMHKMIRDEKTYIDYLIHKDEFSSALEYLTSKKNVIGIKKINDGSCTLEFVSENDGKVQDFIEKLKSEGRIAEFSPLVSSENPLKVV